MEQIWDEMNCQTAQHISTHPRVDANPDVTTFSTFHKKMSRVDEQQLNIRGALRAGTDYTVYCLVQSHHAPYEIYTREQIASTQWVGKTSGCFNCGIKEFPRMNFVASWTSLNSITLVIELSDDGFVYCMAREEGEATG